MYIGTGAQRNPWKTIISQTRPGRGGGCRAAGDEAVPLPLQGKKEI